MEIAQGFLGGYLAVTYVPYVTVFEVSKVSMCLIISLFFFFPLNIIYLGKSSGILNHVLKALQNTMVFGSNVFC